MCYFDITSTVVGLTQGTYILRVWNEDQSGLFGETAIIIPPGPALKSQPLSNEPPSPNRRWWYHSQQEGCKTISQRTQVITMYSYRMRRNMHKQDITERGRAVSYNSSWQDGYVKPISLVEGGR